MAKEITDAQEGRKNLKWLIIAGAVVVLIVVIGIVNLIPARADPMAQFVTQKNCSFLVMGDISRAVCTDGTAYEVKQIGSPLP